MSRYKSHLERPACASRPSNVPKPETPRVLSHEAEHTFIPAPISAGDRIRRGKGRQQETHGTAAARRLPVPYTCPTFSFLHSPSKASSPSPHTRQTHSGPSATEMRSVLTATDGPRADSIQTVNFLLQPEAQGCYSTASNSSCRFNSSSRQR